MSRPIYWFPLSHQSLHNRYRCLMLPLGRIRLALCSRCLGLYPTMVAVWVVQFLGIWPLSREWDWWVALGAAVPALASWGLGRLGHRGRNIWRVATGVALGVALGRSLFMYFREPANEVFWVQMALILCTVLAFEWVRSLRLNAGEEEGDGC
jgi:uncharacterized membrane protein